MKTEAAKLEDVTVTAWARLQRVSQDLLNRVEEDLKQAGHPPLAWYDVLLEIRRAEPTPLRPFQLQEELLLAQYNLSRLLDRMATSGVLERRPCVEDGRGHSLHLTAQGRKLLTDMWPVYAKAIKTHFAARLTTPEREALNGILGKLKTP